MNNEMIMKEVYVHTVREIAKTGRTTLDTLRGMTWMGCAALSYPNEV